MAITRSNLNGFEKFLHLNRLENHPLSDHLICLNFGDKNNCHRLQLECRFIAKPFVTCAWPPKLSEPLEIGITPPYLFAKKLHQFLTRLCPASHV